MLIDCSCMCVLRIFNYETLHIINIVYLCLYFPEVLFECFYGKFVADYGQNKTSNSSTSDHYIQYQPCYLQTTQK